MTKDVFEKAVVPLKERYEYTDREKSIEILSSLNRTYYIDDINYISAGQETYTFWPLGVGNRELFFYIRFYAEVIMDDKVIALKPTLHISTQTGACVSKLLDETAYLRDCLGIISINAAVSVDVHKILYDLNHPFREIPSEYDKRYNHIRYVPTEKTYSLPNIDVFSLCSAEENSIASFDYIMETHPEIIPFYHAKSKNRRYIEYKGKNELNDIQGKMLCLKEHVWTLFRGDQPMLSVIPDTYNIGIIGFMYGHALYSNEVNQSMIDYVLKKLCCIYRDRGYVVRVVTFSDEDPFEGTETLSRIGMIPDYRFVSLTHKQHF